MNIRRIERIEPQEGGVAGYGERPVFQLLGRSGGGAMRRGEERIDGQLPQRAFAGQFPVLGFLG